MIKEQIQINKPSEMANKYRNMVEIPAGNFRMGSTNWGPFESPVHEMYIESFWMDKTPVTNLQFGIFVKATGYKTDAEIAGRARGYEGGSFKIIPGLNWKSFYATDRADHPVILVSWNDAKAYADWAGKRLPTEAEWEKAARGGLVDKLYPWGDETPNGTQSNFAQQPMNIIPTTPVQSFAPNGYGLYDMVGNVWQWCADWFEESYYAVSSTINPRGPELGTTKVRRGGSWNVIQPFRLRNSNRGALPPYAFEPNLGFRCVVSE